MNLTKGANTFSNQRKTAVPVQRQFQANEDIQDFTNLELLREKHQELEQVTKLEKNPYIKMWMQRNVDYLAQLINLQETHQRKDFDLTTLQQKNSTLTDQVQSLETKMLNAHCDYMLMVRRDREKNMHHVEELTAKLDLHQQYENDASSEIVKLRTECENLKTLSNLIEASYKTQIDEIQAKWFTQTNKLTCVSRELKDMEAGCHRLREENTEICRQNKTLEKESEVYKNENKNLVDCIRTQEGTIGTLQDEIVVLKQNFANKIATFEELTELQKLYNKDAYSEIDQLKMDHQKLQLEHEKTMKEMKQHQEKQNVHIFELTSQKDTLYQQWEKATREIDKLKTENGNFKNLSNLIEAGYKTQVDEIQAKCLTQAIKAASMSQKCKDIEAKLTRLGEENITIRNQTENLEKVSDFYKNENNRFAVLICSQEDSIANLQDEIGRLKQDFSQQFELQQQCNKEALSEIDLLKIQNQKLQFEHEKAIKEIKQLQDTQNAHISRLTLQLQTENLQKLKANKESEGLKQASQKQLTQITELKREIIKHQQKKRHTSEGEIHGKKVNEADRCVKVVVLDKPAGSQHKDSWDFRRGHGTRRREN